MEYRLGDARTRFVRPTEAIALALAVAVCSELAANLIGIRNRALLVMFVITWLASAARRLSEFRRGEHAALKAYGETGSPRPAIIVGTGPWLGLVLLYGAYPTSSIWVSGRLPVWLTAIGVGLALMAVMWPDAPASAHETNSSHLMPRLTLHAHIVTLAMLLMSGSLVIGLVFGIWLVIVCGTFANTSRPALAKTGTEGMVEMERAFHS